MPATAQSRKAPLCFANLENDGRFEGQVIASSWKKNKSGTPQVYTTLTQRIRRPDGKRKITYNPVSFVLFDTPATSWMDKVKVGDHVRVYYRATGFRIGKRPFLSLQITKFRKYPHPEENLESWLDDEGFWNPPDWEGYRPEQDEESP